MMIFTLAARELRSLFLSPLAWAILAAVQAILAYFFLLYLDYFVQVQPQLGVMPGAPGLTEIVVSPLFATAAIVLLIVSPLLTMRLLSEERRSQTLALLFSAPVSMTEIVLGKFVGMVAFFAVSLLLISLMPLSLLLGGTLDFGMFLAAFSGLLLLMASFSAVGLFMSTLTTQPAVAAVSTFGVLLLLWILDLATTTGEGTQIFSYVSMLRHYQPMMQGLVNSTDIVYYLLFIAVFLVLSIRRLDAQRLQQSSF
jgi:ABC-2 type transport system permease protein